MQSTFTTADFKNMQAFQAGDKTRSYDFRIKQLKALKTAVTKMEQEIMDALYRDLRKSPEESYATEIGVVHAELTHAIKHLAKWMQPQKVSTPLGLFPSSSKIIREHWGICLIIAPWNYPFMLSIAPLIGAIAGGNCCVLKPSELAPNTAAVIHRLIRENFDTSYISVAEGEGHLVVPELMNHNRFDHVFFTGSIAVGKEIAKMAAEKLIPVVLELGGKSPCIVDREVDIQVAATRIVWGKFTNAGQTCVAPDYLLVHQSRKTELVDAMKENIHKLYGEDPSRSNDYGRIVNDKRFTTLQSFLADGTIIVGGQTNKADRYIAPTLLDNVVLDKPVMQEEIFGPILPIISFDTHDKAIEVINQHPDPLSLYVFTNDTKVEKLYVDKVEFGGGCINNTLVHLGNPDLPFGGVALSGMGSYHGKYSFDTFTRPKSILKTGTWLDPSLKYPPYKGKMKFLKLFFR